MQKTSGKGGLEQKLGRILSIAALGGALLFSGCITAKYKAVFIPKTIPHCTLRYDIDVTDNAKKTSGKIVRVDFPPVEIRKEGYKTFIFDPAPVELNFTANKQEIKDMWAAWGPVDRTRAFQNNESIILEKDPDYRGPIGYYANKAVVQVNSEPRGARIYEDGKLLGTIGTDRVFNLNYVIEPSCYAEKKLTSSPITVVKEGYLPLTQKLELKIDPEWKYKSQQEYKYGTLFLLQRDPNYRPPQQIISQQPAQTAPNQPNQQGQHLTIKQEKDELDFIQQIGQIGIMIKSLQPIKLYQHE